MCITEWIQLGSLVVAAVGLIFLIKYVEYTKDIAEATFKPAIIVVQGGSLDAPPHLRNIGKGPALDIEWEISGTGKTGKMACLEVQTDSPELRGVLGARTFTEGALKAATDKSTLYCSYRAVSGVRYASDSVYEIDSGRFSTTFRK